MKNSTNEQNCWTCAKMLTDGHYFPGRCSGFKDKDKNPLPPVEFPPGKAGIVDVGCMFWVKKIKGGL